MSFPPKNINSNPEYIGPINPIWRKEFIDDLPKKVKNCVRGADLALINEAILAMDAGNAKINGKKPKTRQERYIVIASYFKIGRNNENMFFDGAENVEQNYIVALKYKDKPYTITFPDKPAEN